MWHQSNLKGASAPLVFIIIIVILIVGGFLYFTAQAPEQTPLSLEEEEISEEMMPEGEEALEEVMMAEPEPQEKTEMPPPPAPQGEEEEKQAPEATLKTFNVTGKNFEFSQSEIRVKKGDKVRVNFTSTGGFHDWTVDEFSAATQQVNAGGTTFVEFTADKAGTFEYYCSVGNHRQLGMKGSLVVE